MGKKKAAKAFGQLLRAKRLGKNLSLRRFAGLVGVSPTYLCHVEQCSVDPPTADRVRRMAELLGENVDEWSSLAGRLTEDLPKIIHEAPVAISELLRAIRGLTAEQLRRLRDETERMKSSKIGREAREGG